jgi:monoamine oxidase
MANQNQFPVSRRSLLKLIGLTGGSAVMYETMVAMGYAGTSDFTGPISLSGDVKGASVLILGAGLAGMTAAYELRKAGYKVQVLEYNDRPGGRNWSLYGGDRYTDLSGVTQNIEFEKGLYFNPGPWRIPYHHRGLLHYCKTLNVALESFCQVNYNAYVHSSRAFGGKPKRYREIAADYEGHISELLAKATSQDKLDGAISKDEKDGLLQMLRVWGALDRNYEYKKGGAVSNMRGFDVDAGGGLSPAPVDSDPIPMQQLFTSGMWVSMLLGKIYEFQTQIFQAVGGMGMIGKAFGQALDGLIKYDCKVTEIRQDERGVTATYVDTKKGGAPQTAHGDWCICTIPATILSQLPMNVSAPLKNAINSLSYDAAFKVGLEFKRRFWEEDDGIYGGNSYTDQPISNISYPSTDYHGSGGGVLLGGYVFSDLGGDGAAPYRWEAMSAADQIKAALEQGAKIHPQYMQEYKSGVGISWHRVPWTLGCAGRWSDANRAKNYDAMCAIDGRLVLAGEHCSRLPAWQEGAVLSALDTVKRLHQRVVAG